MYLLYHWYDTLPRPVSPEPAVADAARAPVPQRPALDCVAHWHPGLDWDTDAHRSPARQEGTAGHGATVADTLIGRQPSRAALRPRVRSSSGVMR